MRGFVEGLRGSTLQAFKVLVNNVFMLKIIGFFLNGASIIILKPKGLPCFLVSYFIGPTIAMRGYEITFT
jgi:hypothetical protein